MNNQTGATVKSYKRVMVIDDNPIDRYIAEITIRKAAFSEEVICKESALSALTYLDEQAGPGTLPDLIFLDINMPELNGFDFLDRFASLPAHVHNNCDIMMLSSSLDPQDHSKVQESKFVSRFLNKPLRKEKLAEILRATVIID